MSSPITTRGSVQAAKIQTRAMKKNNNHNQKPNLMLIEAKRRAREMKMSHKAEDQPTIKDYFQNALNAKQMTNNGTGLVYDERMSQHCCLWDSKHPECPERFTRILERCRELNLIEKCKVINSRRAEKHEVLLLHTEEHYKLLEKTANVHDNDNMEELSSQYDSIYIHPTTFELSLLAVGSTIDLVKQVVQGNVSNGMAIIRPPGHHAMKAEFNGYCFFNNVAIATKYALENLKLNRIMIIDWDIHHGQGTQRFFYNDSRVLYFSIHRFEYGKYWPNLRESDFDAIGAAAGAGYNFNLPLNQTGMGNGDYLAIFQQLLIPVAMEYQPELIIVSAGYDAALGCPEGEMEVTPAFYAHLLNPLLKLAQARVAVVLEGGYCLESLSEGAALTLRTLLGEPCPVLVEPLLPAHKVVQEAILNCIYAHRSYWRCLQLQASYTLEDLNNVNPQPELHKINRSFIGGPPLPERFPTRGTAPQIPEQVVANNLSRLQWLKEQTLLITPKVRVVYVYDDLMLQHTNAFETGHPEQPERISRIYEMHDAYDLLKRMHKLPSRSATTDEICLAHTRAHVNGIRRTADRKEALEDMCTQYVSVYFHAKTYECACLAAGSVLQVVDKVLRNEARSGVCIVRPPGHHAEKETPHGFCIFNNVAIAANYALRDYKLQRVLIVDWDVHHGNGTQHMFESNPQVLYISVHRYDNATFFPKSSDANYNVVGKDAGVGFNVNIPWNKKGMGDSEYVLAFQQLIMPIAYEFNPELVLVSAGFDAAVGDPLGGCKVTPEAYGLFTHWLSALANGRIILCLEGGYNVNSIAYAMTMCSKSLLGDPIPTPQVNMSINRPPTLAFQSCVKTLQQCLTVQQKYWKSLVFNKSLPIGSSYQQNNDADFIAALENLEITDYDVQGAAGGSEAADEQPSSSRTKAKTLTDFFIENLQALENQDMYAVLPLSFCPHLSELRPVNSASAFNINAGCSECAALGENWVCLSCHSVCCSRYVNEHMIQHNDKTKHPMALSFADLSVWCYSCCAYVDNSQLYAAKNLAHMQKFNEEMPWAYKEPKNEFVNEEGVEHVFDAIDKNVDNNCDLAANDVDIHDLSGN